MVVKESHIIVRWVTLWIYFIFFINSIYSIIVGGRWRTSSDDLIICLHLCRSLASRSHVLSIHRCCLSSVFCLPLSLFPHTVSWRKAFIGQADFVTWPCTLSLRVLTVDRRSSCRPRFWITILRTSSLMTWSV